jgi:hypothetical protein
MWARPRHRFRRRQTKGLHPSSRLLRRSREEVASNKQEERPGLDWSVCPKLSSCADLLRLVREALEKESWALVVVCGGDLRHRVRPRGGQQRLDHENGDAAWAEVRILTLAVREIPGTFRGKVRVVNHTSVSVCRTEQGMGPGRQRQGLVGNGGRQGMRLIVDRKVEQTTFVPG